MTMSAGNANRAPHAIRRGAHWAQVAVLSSAFAGFVSLFGFLGFGYFDPFHAFVSAILFQFLLLYFFKTNNEIEFVTASNQNKPIACGKQ